MPGAPRFLVWNLGDNGTFSRMTLRSSMKGECIRVASYGARHQPQSHEPNGQGSQTIGKRSVCPRVSRRSPATRGGAVVKDTQKSPSAVKPPLPPLEGSATP